MSHLSAPSPPSFPFFPFSLRPSLSFPLPPPPFLSPALVPLPRKKNTRNYEPSSGLLPLRRACDLRTRQSPTASQLVTNCELPVSVKYALISMSPVVCFLGLARRFVCLKRGYKGALDD